MSALLKKTKRFDTLNDQALALLREAASFVEAAIEQRSAASGPRGSDENPAYLESQARRRAAAANELLGG